MNDQTLEDRLTEEAARQSPAFSPALHNRIMDRIANPPAMEIRPSRLNWRRPLAIAAGLALVVGSFILLHRARPENPNIIRSVAIRNVPSVPEIPNPVHALDDPIVSEWTNARYAYLDRDGEKLLGYVGRQLDFMPRKQQ
jgi:hypothetical protein